MTSPKTLAAEIDNYLAGPTPGVAGMRRPGRRARVSGTDPTTMSAGAINKELDRLDERNSELTQRMIDAGRGHERPSDYLHKMDPLSSEINEISDRRMSLRIEIEGRYGPGAPRRLPARFGTRRRT